MKNIDKYKTNKITSMQYILLVLFIIIILITIFSFNIYATYNNDGENQKVLDEIKEENSYDSNETIIQVILNETENADYVKDLTIEEKEEVAENNEVVQNHNIGKYKSANGKIYDTIANLNIPSIGINYPVLSSTSEELLNVSLNKYWGANPNEVGNMVILGHNYKDGRFFSKLLNIKKGAVVQVTDLSGRTLDYKVYETGVIDPYDTGCTSQLTNGHTDVTLVTCYYENGNVHATKRFYAKARAY